jgi:aromatic ring-opening dioxygenase catalytic subunit (LigB family)
MTVLSILACGMLEDELVHVLSNDPEIKQLFVVENTNSFKFIKRLKAANLKPLVFTSDRLYPLVSESRNHKDLINYENMGKEASLAVPTLDHCLPMIYAIALQEKDETLKFVYEGFQHGSTSMRCFQIG